ncbi:MAG: TRAP transporter substrate-binding protein DctP [Elusimicrobia bacterium]|nr:TRAP transporter substrate-binding protein DctP [Elusimicrobiota bacterium]
MTCSRLLAALLLAAAVPGNAAVIRFATLAPDGTDAMKTMQAIDKEVQEKTGGELKFKFYSGGRQGDEKDMVRKIRVGLLQAGGFTGVGLGEVAPAVRILDAPWLFRNHDEVDYVYKEFAPDFEKAFSDAGYVLLGWTEVGFVYVLSSRPIHGPKDMRDAKMWVWEGDPIAAAAFDAIDVHPIPLSITDVMTSLQTGHIDAVYTAPLYAIALQWDQSAHYIHGEPLANASGAVLISKSFFERLPADQQKVLLDVSRRRLAHLNELTRKANAAALKQLEKQGLKLIPASKAAQAAYEAAGRKARQSLVGRLYPQELLDRVEKALASYRATKEARR